MWSVVSTWAFSLEAAQRAAEVLSGGGSALDAAEQGIRLVESNPCVDCVGRGGFLNEKGELALDAAMMNGDTMKMGAVCAVQGYENPVTIARAVMERTPHSMLVGEGAEEFARMMGIPAADADRLITPVSRAYWEKEREKHQLSGHDTIGAVTLDRAGTMVAATSTSGACLRASGRVGDSPIIGSGFYVESGVGGAVCTGWGEDIMRTCCAFRCVDLMRGGLSAQDAAETVVRTAHETILRHGGKPDCIAIACMNAAGEFAGAANHKGYWIAYAREGAKPDIRPIAPVIDKDLPQGETA